MLYLLLALCDGIPPDFELPSENLCVHYVSYAVYRSKVLKKISIVPWWFETP